MKRPLLILASLVIIASSKSHTLEAQTAYPARPADRIKGVQVLVYDWNNPSAIGNVDDIAGNQAGNVGITVYWHHAEPSSIAPTSGACPTSQPIVYDNRCYTLVELWDNGQHPLDLDAQIAAFANRGVLVTLILAGVPEWAAVQNGCTAQPFCAPAPNRVADFARFAGMLANRYNGVSPKVRVADFVIHNEVNAMAYYDIGCENNVCHNHARWMDRYAEDYNAAYDRIKLEQSTAKIFAPFTGHFAIADQPYTLSVKTFVRGIAARSGGRDWRVAIHPYPISLGSPYFSPDDWPHVTFGNVGVLAGWLHQEFPSDPHAWEIHITEAGVTSTGTNNSSSEALQAQQLCNAYQNVLATPGYDSFIWYSQIDQPAALPAELRFGLISGDWYAPISYKPSWGTWALMNRADLGLAHCGFQHLPYVKLARYSVPNRGHWASTRIPPAGSTLENSWKLLRDPAPGTQMLYECMVPSGSAYTGPHTMATTGSHCEFQLPMGPLGYAYTSPAQGRVALYRCLVTVPTHFDHFLSTDSNCEGWTQDLFLGYVLL